MATFTVQFEKPQFSLGQVVYVPQRTGPTRTVIREYGARIGKLFDDVKGVVTNYRIQEFVDLR